MTDMTIAQGTLDTRLACACNCAYGISHKDGSYTPPQPYDSAVGWTDTPIAISAPKAGGAEDERINACLVGRNGDGIIIAMRGTLPPSWTVASLQDWWQDIVDSKPIDAPPLIGKVHEGFWDALNTIWEKLVAAVSALKTAYPADAIYVTGHSKGGPMATIGATRLLGVETLSVAKVITFASPHPGNGDFVTHYPKSIPVTRYENYLDIVPFLPPTDTFYEAINTILPARAKAWFCKTFPSICNALEHASEWDYTPLGELLYVDDKGEILHQGDFYARPLVRLLEIIYTLAGWSWDANAEMKLEGLKAMTQSQGEAKLSESGLSRIGAAHCIGCKCDKSDDLCAGGYMEGAGGDDVCAHYVCK